MLNYDKIFYVFVMLLFIDNFDSFTYNLVQYFEQLGEEVCVWQNNQKKLTDVANLHPDYIVVGPGPCTPNEAGISLDLIKQFSGKVPILGVCLGHQAIGQAFGGQIVKANQVMHGRVSPIAHADIGIFANLPNLFLATRYHSLVIDNDSLPECLEITAWTMDNDKKTIMGVRHKTLAVEGVQFHPESILSEQGHQILQNFLHKYRKV